MHYVGILFILTGWLIGMWDISRLLGPGKICDYPGWIFEIGAIVGLVVAGIYML